MNPPIPDPMAAVSITDRGPRPAGLKYLVAAGIILSILSGVRIYLFPPQESAFEVGFDCLASICWFLLLVWLWGGSASARIWVIGLSIFDILIVFGLEAFLVVAPMLDESIASSLDEAFPVHARIEYFAWIIFSAVAIFYLVSPAMKAYCLPSKAK